MTDTQDWFADTEGNLTAPGDGKPPTDEFGRDDPASLEREQRRRAREARRKPRKAVKAAKPPKAAKQPKAAKPATAAKPPKAQAAVAAPPRRKARKPTPNSPEGGGDGGDPAPRGPRIFRGHKNRRGAYRRRRFLALGLLLVGALVAWFLIAFFQPPPFDPGNGSGEAIVTVPEGATASDVADLLTENDVVSNGTLFKWRLALAGKSDQILPGRYILAHNMSYGAAIDKLTGAGGKVTVTIPEGEARDQIAPQAANLGLTGDYLASTKSFKGFNPAQYGASNPRSLEGFLFPATYQVDPGASVDQLVNEQLQGFKLNFGQVNLSYAKSKNLTPYDVITIASMIDKEVMVPSERRLVAAVIYNRLHRGMPLGIDATTRYEFHNYTGELTPEQLSSQSAYNTRTHAGLPPTPIGNPGRKSLEAAANPAREDYLFYVIKPCAEGAHAFSSTNAQFERDVAAYDAKREELGGKSPVNC